MDGVKVIPVDVNVELLVIGFLVEMTFKEALRVSSREMPTPLGGPPKMKVKAHRVFRMTIYRHKRPGSAECRKCFLTQGFMLIMHFSQSKDSDRYIASNHRIKFGLALEFV